MSNYLKRMYNSGSQSATPPEKNPNRVAGGLRAQGADSLSMLGEDGQEKEIPTKRYVQTLEEKVKNLDSKLQKMHRDYGRHDAKVQRLAAMVDQLRRG